MSFQLTGLRGFEAALEKASEAIRADVADVLEDTAAAVQANARRHVPYDRGDLARAIQYRGKGLSWRVGVADAPVPGRGGRNSAHLNPGVYGVWYEYGFVTRKIERRPFMTPAVNAERARHESRLVAALRGALTQAA